MIRAAIVTAALLAAPLGAAELDAGEAYEACLVGRFVIEQSAKTPEPFMAAVLSCAEFAAAVPADYPFEEAESYGPGLVEENALHFTNSLLPTLMGYTIDGELGAEY